MYSIEKYCNQTVKDLIANSGLVIESNTCKIDVLVKSASIYKMKGLISEETYEVLVDKRFVRLYNTKVRKLQRMLADNNIHAPKQGKSKIVLMCYNMGLDSGNSSWSDDSVSGDEVSNMCGLRNAESVGFYVANRKIYLGNEDSHIEITDEMLKQLFALLVRFKTTDIQ